MSSVSASQTLLASVFRSKSFIGNRGGSLLRATLCAYSRFANRPKQTAVGRHVDRTPELRRWQPSWLDLSDVKRHLCFVAAVASPWRRRRVLLSLHQPGTFPPPPRLRSLKHAPWYICIYRVTWLRVTWQSRKPLFVTVISTLLYRCAASLWPPYW